MWAPLRSPLGAATPPGSRGSERCASRQVERKAELFFLVRREGRGHWCSCDPSCSFIPPVSVRSKIVRFRWLSLGFVQLPVEWNPIQLSKRAPQNPAACVQGAGSFRVGTLCGGWFSSSPIPCQGSANIPGAKAHTPFAMAECARALGLGEFQEGHTCWFPHPMFQVKPNAQNPRPGSAQTTRPGRRSGGIRRSRRRRTRRPNRRRCRHPSTCCRGGWANRELAWSTVTSAIAPSLILFCHGCDVNCEYKVCATFWNQHYVSY